MSRVLLLISKQLDLFGFGVLLVELLFDCSNVIKCIIDGGSEM